MAFVDFATLQGAASALNLHGTRLDGRVLEVKPVGTSDPSNNSEKFSIYVMNISIDATETLFRAHFEKCGDIEGVRLPRHRDTGNLTGYGFVDFASKASMKRALKMNRSRFLGRQLLISESSANNASAGSTYILHLYLTRSGQSGSWTQNARTPLQCATSKSEYRNITWECC